MSKNGNFGGVPTREIVEQLMLLNTGEGASVDYKAVEDIIAKCGEVGVKWNTPRFRTITNVWRRRLLGEKNLRSIAQGGKFDFLTVDQYQDVNRKGRLKLARGVRRHSKHVNRVDPRRLSSDERRAIQILEQRHASAFASAFNAAARQIAMPAPVNGQASFRKPDDDHASAG